MSSVTPESDSHGPMPLVPRLSKQGYTKEDVSCRREWVETQTGTSLQHVGSYSLDSQTMRGNIENPIGVAQIPLGIAGPLRVEGEHASGEFYVPLATTEGALVRSYERGMIAITRAGGAIARISDSGNRACPIFSFDGVANAHHFAQGLGDCFLKLKEIAESTTNHGKLLEIRTRQIGRDVVVDFQYDTGDAHGMNMVSKATEAACHWLAGQFNVERHYVLTGGSSEKRASGSLFRGGKGKHVTAGVTLPRKIVQNYLHTTSAQLCHMWQRTLLAQLQAGSIGFNGHYANGLTAIFIACGQDVANITNCAVGITSFDAFESGDLFASVTLPSLTIGTIGGGTGLGTAKECLSLLDCDGTGKANKFAEIIAAAILAGELSFGAALATGEFVNAHEKYGRNRPHAVLMVGDNG